MDDIKLDENNLVAHRGLQASFPENTLLSLSKAIEVGARYIELDVQFSADHLPIIYHDADLQRVSNRRDSVKNIERQTLLTYPAYEPLRFGDLYIAEKIAPLEVLVTLLKANPEVTAFVELKEDSIPHCGRDRMIQSVQSILNPVSNRTVIISEDYKLIYDARRVGWPYVGVVLKQWQDMEDSLVIDSCADYLFIEYQFIPQILGKISSTQSVKLVAYEVSDQMLANRLLALGMDMLETFKFKSLMS
jgi:glycerophosphoryl diester phosphodiesterase